MSDPTIQTFCCHHNNESDLAVSIMQEFNTDAYNVVCLFSSTLGIIGALYQILPRQQYANNHRWLSFSAARGRKIIVWLAIADLMASIGIFTRSTLWINYKNIMPDLDDDSSVVFCAVSSAWTQYFYTATWIWTLCYAIDMRFILSEKEALTKYYHIAAWIIPAILTTFGLSLLYLPNADCHTSTSFRTALLRILPNYIATYIPIAIVMIANPCLYHTSCKDMERIITASYGQFTSKERDIIDCIKIKFSVMNIIFYMCWFPNLINGILLWTLWFNLPVRFVISVWYIMALTNPLQALFNSMVYRRWTMGSEEIILPWRRKKVERKISNLSFRSSISSESRSPILEERMPLLQNKFNVANEYFLGKNGR